MWGAELVKQLRASESGAAILEFTLVAWFFFLVVFGTVEFGYYMWQFGAITKGGEEGLRYAVVTDPVTSDWTTLLPNSGKVITCRGGAAAASATCTLGTVNQTAITCIVNRVRAFAPFVRAQNVVIEYQANAIGLAGAFAPTIKLKLENVTFTSIFLGFMGGRKLPPLNFTMTAEDLSTAAPGNSTVIDACGIIS
jgi:hypothetical protein